MLPRKPSLVPHFDGLKVLGYSEIEHNAVPPESIG